MSMNYPGSSDNTAKAGESDLNPVAESEPTMFAPVPSWERGKKKRGFGAKKAVAVDPIVTTSAAGLGATADPMDAELTGRSFAQAPAYVAPLYSDTPAPTTRIDPLLGPTTSVRDDNAPLVAPIGRTAATSAKRQGGLPVAAIGAGVLALGALVAGGWYATQPRDNVAELTPGVADSTTTTAMAPIDPALAAPAATVPAQTTTTTTTTVRATAPAPSRATTTRTASVTRTRPAAANSAQTVGINASGTAELPSAPQAYSGTASSSANTSATSPATVNPAPVEIPSTPPVAAEPAPTPVTPIEPTVTPGA
ncbi:hypothetical protein [Phenylobacterium sp.]|uniref:hypothetical protein n=1 Tax=Phenylobacterium sp. TaxID=1871053 RepID=UPI0039836AA4